MITEAATKSALAKEKIDELKRRIESIKAENRKFDANQKSIRDWEGLYQLYDNAMPDTLMDKDQLESSLEIILARIQERKADYISHRNRERAKNESKYSYSSNTRTNCRVSR